MELSVAWVVKPFLGDMYGVKIIWRRLSARLGDGVTSQDLEQVVKNAGKHSIIFEKKFWLRATAWKPYADNRSFELDFLVHVVYVS